MSENGNTPACAKPSAMLSGPLCNDSPAYVGVAGSERVLPRRISNFLRLGRRDTHGRYKRRAQHRHSRVNDYDDHEPTHESEMSRNCIHQGKGAKRTAPP